MSFEGDPFNIVLTKFTGQPHTAEPYKQSGTSFPSSYSDRVLCADINLSHLQGNIKKISGFLYW